MNDNTLTLIEKHEGYKRNIYTDTLGHNTIGIGFNLDAGMTKDEARCLARYKINNIRSRLSYLIPTFNALSARRKDVLIDVAYNIGIGGLMNFKKMLAAINEGNFKRAKLELLDSNAARELHNRYGELAEMMEDG